MYSRNAHCLFLILHLRSVLYCPCSFNFFSCSTICLLQLRNVSAPLCSFALFLREVLSWCDVLSAGEESALLGHLVAVLALCRDCPDHANNGDQGKADDSGVALPVGGLRIPTTSGRPDVLRVPGCGQRAGERGIGWRHLRDLSSSAHCEV